MTLSRVLWLETSRQESGAMVDLCAGAYKDYSNGPGLSAFTPSFARFYLESKFGLHLSESRILEMLEGMDTHIPQSSLNEWMHEIMQFLRLQLEELMLEAVRKSFFT